jgi:RES domain-containing protein
LLRLYRICRNIYDPADPTGASQTPGRWHILGQRVLYFCSSLAMCILELKANSVPFNVLRENYHYVALEIDTSNINIEEVPEAFYSKEWILNRRKTQEYGNEWFESGRSLILKVSSAVLPTDSNFIINTTHPYFTKLKFHKPLFIPLDPRVK